VSRGPATARRLFDRFEPVHALTYFAPEARTAFDGVGLRGFWMGYFVARLWHAATLPREQRGDAHVAVLVANGVGWRECNVLHSVADRVPRDFIMRSRQYDDDESALHAFDSLDDAELELLFRTLTPITMAVIAGGDIPAATPMGLRRDDLDDDGAHLD
jgi:hypothetical protein